MHQVFSGSASFCWEETYWHFETKLLLCYRCWTTFTWLNIILHCRAAKKCIYQTQHDKTCPEFKLAKNTCDGIVATHSLSGGNICCDNCNSPSGAFAATSKLAIKILHKQKIVFIFRNTPFQFDILGPSKYLSFITEKSHDFDKPASSVAILFAMKNFGLLAHCSC